MKIQVALNLPLMKKKIQTLLTLLAIPLASGLDEPHPFLVCAFYWFRWRKSLFGFARIPAARHIHSFHTSTRVIARTRQELQNLCPSVPVHGNNEMDSHADTCVFGPNFVILAYTGRECDVYAYSSILDAVTGVLIVSGATAWTHPETGETFVLIVHEGLCPSFPVHGNNEMDSYADTCVFGPNFVILAYTGRERDIDAYSFNLDAVTGVLTVSGATLGRIQRQGGTLY